MVSKKITSSLLLIFLIVIVFMGYNAFRHRSFLLTSELDKSAQKIVTVITPLVTEKVYNPFFVKARIVEQSGYTYSVKLNTLDFKTLFEGPLVKEEDTYNAYVMWTASTTIDKALLQFYKTNTLDNSSFLLDQFEVQFTDSSSSATLINLLTAKSALVTIRAKEFSVEVANDFKERTKGLSGHAPLAQNQGMLFVFEKSGYESFWMKDMRFPIDIIWINYDTIVSIEHSVPVPKSNSALEVYSPKARANIVLEIPSGTAQKYGFTVGDKVKFK